MKRIAYWFMVLVCLFMVGFFSKQPSQKQDIRPIIHQHKYLIKMVEEMPQIKFPYAGKIVDSRKNAVDFLHFLFRKLVHFTLYGFLGVLLIMATGGFNGLKAIRWILVGLGLMIVAVGDELNQVYTPGRTGCPEDVIIDMLGFVVISFAILVGTELMRFVNSK